MSAKIVALVLSLVLNAPPDPASPAAPSDSGLSEAGWGALVDEPVAVETGSGTRTGTLSAQTPTTIILILEDGSVLELDKADVTSVKIQSQPAPLPPATTEGPVVPAPVVNGCFDDDQCGHPRSCVAGQCVVSANYVDALEREGQARMKGGKWTMVTGAGILGVGLIMAGVSYGVDKSAWTKYQNANCSDWQERTLSELECTNLNERSTSAWHATNVSLLVLPVGALVVLAGGIAYAVGKGKLRRASAHRATVSANGDGFSVGVVGHF